MPKVILFIHKILFSIFFAVKKNNYLPFVFRTNPRLNQRILFSEKYWSCHKGKIICQQIWCAWTRQYRTVWQRWAAGQLPFNKFSGIKIFVRCRTAIFANRKSKKRLYKKSGSVKKKSIWELRNSTRVLAALNQIKCQNPILWLLRKKQLNKKFFFQ